MGQVNSSIDRVMVEMSGPIHIVFLNTVPFGDSFVSTQTRRTLNPGDDLTDEDPRIVAIAQAVWTPEVIQMFNDSKESRLSGAPPSFPTLFSSEGPNNG